MSNIVKINISIDKDLLDKIDKTAKSLCISRSGYIAYSCSQNMKADELIQSIPEFIGIISQTRDELKEFNNKSLEPAKIGKGKRNI